ncbi:MAG: flavodoxin-dependent (E)-4-hydroxy-3-methylbut-2-enyl-diphosphate synthase [Clostridia bacterium]|nr:flavodoxin-dependent (E)-4-hydroxy-3-methylbut-2-enyl-diphosphate synthase [Clostridia bacterium]
MEGRSTVEVNIGGVVIGGNNPVAVQSMTNTDTKDAKSTLEQIAALKARGCDIVRCAVYDSDCIEPLKTIVKQAGMPVVADIHFDYRLALKSIEAGVAKVRINPGNIGDDDKIRMVADAAKANGVPIRVGANSGSINADFEKKYGRGAVAIAESALANVTALEKVGFDNIVISAKSSNVKEMLEIYRYISGKTSHPLHLGVTEAGDVLAGTVKSAVGIGALLLEGIGDTVRVSLTADPVKEIDAAYEILRAVGLYDGGVEIISCPTCARTKYDLEGTVARLREKFAGEKRSLTVAVMGCVVNGPGEASHADIGIAGGKGKVVLFEHGEKIATYPEAQAVDALYERAMRLLDNKKN